MWNQPLSDSGLAASLAASSTAGPNATGPGGAAPTNTGTVGTKTDTNGAATTKVSGAVYAAAAVAVLFQLL